MTRRRLLMFGFLVVLLMLGVGGIVLWAQPRTPITMENAEKIQKGMTLAEVEEILGGPERDDTTGPLEYRIDFVFIHGNPPPPWPLTWTSDHITIQIVLDLDGRVEELHYCSLHAQESPLDMLRRWLRL